MTSNARFTRVVRPNRYSSMGWEDYLAGRPYPREYEGWTETSPRHYERGRLRAAGAPLVYDRVPEREPPDILERTNGLRLIPRGRR